MKTYPTPHTERAAETIRDKNDGEMCGCPICRALLISAFAVDLAETFDQTDSLDTLIEATVRSFDASGFDAADVIRAVVRNSHPEHKHATIQIRVEPMTDEQHDLLLRPAEGTA